MLRTCGCLLDLARKNSILVVLILILSLSLFIFWLNQTPVEIQAQVGSPDIANGMHISNKAPSLDGGWQTSSLNGQIINGDPNRPNKNDSTELEGYQLWRKRSDAKGSANYYNDHYEEQCDEIRYYYDSDGYAYPYTYYYDCDDPSQEGNIPPIQGPKRSFQNNATSLSLGPAVLDWSPYLVIGGYLPGKSGGGFEDKTLHLDVWLPEGTTSFELASKDFCDKRHTNDLYSANGKSKIYFLHGNEGGNQEKIDVFDCGSATSTPCTNSAYDRCTTIDIRNFQPIGERPIYISSNAPAQNYEYYGIKAEAEVTSSLYVNQFQLEITNPANTGYLTAAATNTEAIQTGQTQTGQTVDILNAFPLSMRLPGNNKKADYFPLEIMWQAEIYVAPDPDLGCSYNDDSKVGMYDTDYPEYAQNWMQNNVDQDGREFRPKITIDWIQRNLLGFSTSTNWGALDWQPHPSSPLEFGHLTDSSIPSNPKNPNGNVWDTHDVNFEGDKIYRFRISNIDQRTWIQVSLPFDQMNALQKCIFKPLVKVFYSDISAGGRFGLGETSDACRNQSDIDAPGTPTYAGLYTHILGGPPNDPNKIVDDSSSAEYGVRVRDTITGFYSAFKRNPPAAPSSTKGLTFANNQGLIYGGDFGKSRCIPNYWRGASNLDFIPTDSLEIGTRTGVVNDIAHKPSIEPYITLTNSSASSDLKLKTTIYIEGDLLIADNILNNSSSTWDNFNKIGYITIIVKGDILIRQNVSQIDAVLIAYPETGREIQNIEDDKKGRIYTCYPESIDIDTVAFQLDEDIDSSIERLTWNSSFYNGIIPDSVIPDVFKESCSFKRLVVNGALIAREIHLGRTYVDTTQPYDIGYFVSEEINLLPEYFIGIPNLPGFEDWLHRSDSIHILPVNF